MKSNTIPNKTPTTISSFFSPCAILNIKHKSTETIGIMINNEHFRMLVVLIFIQSHLFVKLEFNE